MEKYTQEIKFIKDFLKAASMIFKFGSNSSLVLLFISHPYIIGY